MTKCGCSWVYNQEIILKCIASLSTLPQISNNPMKFQQVKLSYNGKFSMLVQIQEIMLSHEISNDFTQLITESYTKLHLKCNNQLQINSVDACVCHMHFCCFYYNFHCDRKWIVSSRISYISIKYMYVCVHSNF